MHGRPVSIHMVYLVQLIISKVEKAEPTSEHFMQTSVFFPSTVTVTL